MIDLYKDMFKIAMYSWIKKFILDWIKYLHDTNLQVQVEYVEYHARSLVALEHRCTFGHMSFNLLKTRAFFV